MLLAPGKTSLKEQALHSLDKLPPFSPVLNRLLATLAEEDVSFGKLADLIEKDTVLAGNVLKLVNSGMYGRRSNVNSVRHAVAILGAAKLRNAALGMSVTRMWSSIQTPPGWSMARFNLHSIATAILADLLSQEVRVVYPEGAFVAGLLHDMGRLLTAVALPREYGEIEKLCESGARTRIACEQQVLGYTHAELSGEALAVWNLPEPIQTAVRYHHEPERDPTEIGPGVIALSRLVQLTDEYTSQNSPECLHGLGLDSKLARVLSEFEVEFESIKGLF